MTFGNMYRLETSFNVNRVKRKPVSNNTPFVPILVDIHVGESSVVERKGSYLYAMDFTLCDSSIQ